MGDGMELWETMEAGVDVVMFHLGAARTFAQLGGIYRTNAESKLQCEYSYRAMAVVTTYRVKVDVYKLIPISTVDALMRSLLSQRFPGAGGRTGTLSD